MQFSLGGFGSLVYLPGNILVRVGAASPPVFPSAVLVWADLIFEEFLGLFN